jgi:hypothetical protein
MRSDLFCSWAAGRLKYSRPTNHNRDTGIFAQEGEGNVSITCVDTKQRKHVSLSSREASLEERLGFRLG